MVRPWVFWFWRDGGMDAFLEKSLTFLSYDGLARLMVGE